MVGLTMYFNRQQCPAGWSEYGDARGRYVVGLTAPGGLGGMQGVAMANLENRPVGRHTHGVTDPGHSHAYTPPVLTKTGSGNSQAGVGSPVQTGLSPTGISLQDAGGTDGTNAPYIQLLLCEKQ